MTNEELKKTHRTSMYNRDFLLKNLENPLSKCGCFYCGEIYHPKEIVEWCDKQTTALCPKCGIDSVLDEIQNVLSYDLLEEMHRYSFLNGYESDGTPIKMKDRRMKKFNE